MKPEDIARTLLSDPMGAIVPEQFHTVLIDRIAAAILAERRRAAMKVCRWCARGAPVETQVGFGLAHFVNDGIQPRGQAGRWVACSAAAILGD